MTAEQVITAKYNNIKESIQVLTGAVKPSLQQIKVKLTPGAFVEMASEKLEFQLETSKILKEIEEVVEIPEEFEIEVRTYDPQEFPVMEDLPLRIVATKRRVFMQLSHTFFDDYPFDRVPYSFVKASLMTGIPVNINNRVERQIEKERVRMARMEEIFGARQREREIRAANQPSRLEAIGINCDAMRVQLENLVAVRNSRVMTDAEREIEQQVDFARGGNTASNHYLINLYFKRISELQAIEAKKPRGYEYRDPRPRGDHEDLIDMIMMIGQPEPPPKQVILG